MQIALVDSNRKPKIYPYPLLKLGAWLKEQGHDCKLYHNSLPQEHVDEIWMTVTFTYGIPHAIDLAMQATLFCNRVLLGGPAVTLMPEQFAGFDIHKGLHLEAQDYAPDYTLLGHSPKYSIVYSTRGCVRKCGFCPVKKLEPDFYTVPDWTKGIDPGTRKLVFFDNNFLGAPIEHIKDTIARIPKHITSVDFNQGLDCRLMTEEKADILSQIKISPIRFAFDTMEEDGYYQDAIRMMHARGARSFIAMVLYNFTDTPEEFYYRLKTSVELSVELGVQIKSFPMRYHSLKSMNKISYTGKHWTDARKRALVPIQNNMASFGIVAANSIEEFYFWFGRNPQEFLEILDYPGLSMLAKKKKGALRIANAIRKREGITQFVDPLEILKTYPLTAD